MFELLEHTADIGILASGRDAAEAFGEAARGLFAVLLEDPEAVEERETRTVEVKAADQEALLVDWLNELIFLQEAERFLLRRPEVREVAPDRLTAVLHGERYDPARHRINLQVKAATYHQVQVQHDGGWHLRIILDV